MNRFSFKSKVIDRVLLIHPFGIGDALFITPLIRTLKENGVKQIDLLLGSRTREIFETNPNISRIYEWDKSKLTRVQDKIKRFSHLIKLFFHIWNNRYQMMFDFSPTGQYAFLCLFFFWIPLRVGFHFKHKGFFLTHKIDLPHGFVGKSMVEYYLDLIRLMGLEPSNRRIEFFLREDHPILAETFLQKLGIQAELPFIAVVPGGGESWGHDARLKRWPVRHFSSLIQKFLEPNRVIGAILILGSKNERNLANELIRELNQNSIFNLCGETSIPTAAYLLKKSLFLIANDSGLVHLAHALEVPVVSIFGPVDPQVYGPYPQTKKEIVITNRGPACRPCYQQFRYQRLCTEVECLSQLTPEHVYQQIETSGLLNSVKLVVLK